MQCFKKIGQLEKYRIIDSQLLIFLHCKTGIDVRLMLELLFIWNNSLNFKVQTLIAQVLYKKTLLSTTQKILIHKHPMAYILTSYSWE
jgi:hypothetical protein